MYSKKMIERIIKKHKKDKKEKEGPFSGAFKNKEDYHRWRQGGGFFS